MTNEEQLLQESCLEAEKVYPYEGELDYTYVAARRDGYIACYIANGKKQMIEAVEFAEYCMKNIYDIDFSKTTEEIYGLFKQQKQK
jgi:hypothetical protein